MLTINVVVVLVLVVVVVVAAAAAAAAAAVGVLSFLVVERSFTVSLSLLLPVMTLSCRLNGSSNEG
jgi:hypothetical protein